MTTPRHRRSHTAFVPRVVFRTAFVGVIPAIAACHRPNVIVLAVAAFSDAPQAAATDAAVEPATHPGSVIVLAVAAFDASMGTKPRPSTRRTIVLAHQAFGPRTDEH